MALTATDVLQLLREGKLSKDEATKVLTAISTPGGKFAATQENIGREGIRKAASTVREMMQGGRVEGEKGYSPTIDALNKFFVTNGTDRLTRIPGNLGQGPAPTPNMGGSYQRGVSPAINNLAAGAGALAAPAAAVALPAAAVTAPGAVAASLVGGLAGQAAVSAGVEKLGPPLGFKPNREDVEAGGNIGGILGGSAPALLKKVISGTPKLSAAMEAAKTWQEKNKVYEKAQAYAKELFGKLDIANEVHKLRTTETSAAPQKAKVDLALLESQTAAKQDAIAASKATLQAQKDRGAAEVKRLAESAKRLKNQPGYEAAVRQAEVAQKDYEANLKFAAAKESHALADAELNNFNKDLTKEQISSLQRRAVAQKNEAARLQASGRTAPKTNPKVKEITDQITEIQKTIDEAHKALGTADPEVIKNSALGPIYDRKMQELAGLKSKLGAIAEPTEGAMSTAGQRKAKITDLKNAARNTDQLIRDVRAGVEEVPVAPEQEKTWQNLSKAKIRAEQEMENARINLQSLGEHKNQVKLDLARNRAAGVNPAEADAVDEIFGKIAEAQDAHIAAINDKLNHSIELGKAKNNITLAPLEAVTAETEAKLAAHKLAIEHAQAKAYADTLHPGDAPDVPLSGKEKLKKFALSQVLPATMGMAGAATGIPHAEGVAGLVGEIPAIVSAFQKGPTRTAANMPPISTPTPSALREMLMKRLAGSGVNTSVLGALLPGYLDGNQESPAPGQTETPQLPEDQVQ